MRFEEEEWRKLVTLFFGWNMELAPEQKTHFAAFMLMRATAMPCKFRYRGTPDAHRRLAYLTNRPYQSTQQGRQVLTMPAYYGKIVQTEVPAWGLGYQGLGLEHLDANRLKPSQATLARALQLFAFQAAHHQSYEKSRLPNLLPTHALFALGSVDNARPRCTDVTKSQLRRARSPIPKSCQWEGPFSSKKHNECEQRPNSTGFEQRIV